MLKIRKATPADLPSITEIYNEAILTTNATFDSEPRSLAQQTSWFETHDSRHPVLIAGLDAAIVAWASLSEWSTRYAYADTAEISIYVRERFRGQGIGRQLMTEIIIAGEHCGLHTILARITDGNMASIHLHRSAGFEDIGVMREVGYKFNQLLDVRLMQLVYRRKEPR